MRTASSMTRIRFWLEYACAVITSSPAWGLFLVTNPLRSKKSCGSVRITDVSGDTGMDEFATTVADALELVKSKDVRRFGRIQDNLRFVIRMRKPAAARYLWIGRSCLINERRYPESPGPARVLRLACTLVHESTHGYILRKRIPVSSCKERHEDICTQEVRRFLKRVRTQWADEAEKI